MSTPDTILQSGDDAPWAALRFERDRLRSEIRTRMDRMLVLLTGIADAHMCWTEEGFLDKIVFEYHCGVESWPRHWPFKNLSDIQGGCKPLWEIRDAIVSGELRIVKLTDEQVAEARANPESFLPNPTLRSSPTQSRRTQTYHVIPLVLHPYDLSPISHSQSSKPPSGVSLEPPQPSSSSVASPLIQIAPGPETTPRRQRRDIKKRRHCPVTNPDDRPPRRRRLGVQTPEYVYDPVPAPAPAPAPSEAGEDEKEDTYDIMLGPTPSDDYIECFTEPGTQSSEVESEIESATESWAAGDRSEIEDFTSDEE